MQEEKQIYTLEDLLNNESFVEHILSHTDESKEFWQNIIDGNKVDKLTFDTACEIILNIQNNNGTDNFIDSRIPIIWERIEKTTKRPRLWIYTKYIAAIAAIIAVAILIAPHLINNESLSSEIIYTQINDTEQYDDIQLIVSGEKLTIPGDEAEFDYSGQKNIIINKDQIIDKKENNQTMQMNQLIVPQGKRSFIVLSDNSKIWVNAGSRIIYPSHFSKDRREIFIEGEVYADITHNPKWPFVIKTQELNINVLGTEFNVQAYKDDKVQTVVLVEGSVSVGRKESKTYKLEPNQMYYSSNNQSGVQNVDVINYISWKDGYYYFKDEKLGIILQRLSRYYGVKIEYSPEVYSLLCSGGLDYKDDLKQILDGICLSAPINYETLENNTYKFNINH